MSKGEWVDFKTIRAKVSIEQVLDHLGIDNLRREGKSLVGPCPVHGGDNPRAFRIDTAKNAWYCFTQCKRGGNQLDLMVAVRDVSVRNAALELKREFLDKPGEYRRVPERPTARTPERREASANTNEESTVTENKVIDVSLNLAADYPYLAERGVTAETAERFGIGYCSRGIMRGTIAIPVHNREGGLVAYAGRRLKPQDIRELGKYKFPKGFRKDLELYNWHRAWPEIERRGYVIVVEGFFSVFALAVRGYANTVAVMGSSLSNSQAAILSCAPEVVLMFDGDPAGDAGGKKAHALLKERVLTRRVDLPALIEPESLSDAALRWVMHGAIELSFRRITLELDGIELGDESGF